MYFETHFIANLVSYQAKAVMVFIQDSSGFYLKKIIMSVENKLWYLVDCYKNSKYRLSIKGYLPQLDSYPI